MDKWQSIFGGTIKTNIKWKGQPNERVLYRWAMHGNNAKKVLEQLVPYLALKQRQALLAINRQILVGKKLERGASPGGQVAVPMRDWDRGIREWYVSQVKAEKHG